ALGDETKSRRPEIPWRQIGGLRDLLAHEYYRIDMAEIDRVIKRDVAPLETAVTALRRRPRPA
ncbi:MAG: HepT-like ribonuclease domain-containing protein, partial [Chloroflexota bacterium]